MELTHGALVSYDDEGDQFLGNLSTRASKDQPAAVATTITSLFYTIVDQKEWIDMPFPVGTPFGGKKFPSLSASLDGRKMYVIAAVNIGFITGWGIDCVVTGPMSDSVNQFLESLHPAALKWKKLVTSHKKELGKLVLDNLSELATVLPQLPTGTTVVSDPFYRWTPLSDAEQQLSAVACAHHSETLAQYAVSSPVGHTITLKSGARGGGSQMGDTDVDSVLATPKKDSPTDSERRFGIWSLFGGTFRDAGDGSGRRFHPPTFVSEALEAILDTNKKAAAHQLVSLINDTQDTNFDSRDRFLQLNNLDSFNHEVTAAFLLHLKPSDDNLSTMTASSLGMFTSKSRSH